MLPILAEIITLAACLAPKKAPKTFTSKTLLKSSFSNSKIPDSMISSFPYFGCIYIACPRPFRHQIRLLHHNGCKRWIQSLCLCKLSGQARLGYLLLGPLHHVKQKSLAVVLPMPLAPPVINATLPSNLQGERDN